MINFAQSTLFLLDRQYNY